MMTLSGALESYPFVKLDEYLIQCTIETDELHETLQAGYSFKTAVYSQKLFWIAYCQSIQGRISKELLLFDVSLRGNRIIFQGTEQVICQIYSTIDKIRKCLIASFESGRPCEIVVESCDGFQCCLYTPGEGRREIARKSPDLPEVLYLRCIKPALPSIARSCGGIIEEEKIGNVFRAVDETIRIRV